MPSRKEENNNMKMKKGFVPHLEEEEAEDDIIITSFLETILHSTIEEKKLQKVGRKAWNG
jgi:hypothetical protein